MSVGASIVLSGFIVGAICVCLCIMRISCIIYRKCHSVPPLPKVNTPGRLDVGGLSQHQENVPSSSVVSKVDEAPDVEMSAVHAQEGVIVTMPTVTEDTIGAV